MTQNGPPLFQRSPRFHPEVPKGAVDIEPPPAAPNAPTINGMSILMGLLPGLIGAAVMFVMYRSMGGAAMLSLGYSLPLLLVGCAVQMANLSFQKKRYRADMRTREQKYRDLLRNHSAALEQARELQLTALLKKDSSPAAFLTRAEQRSSRLWERSPQDADFLSIRLGLGTLPLTLQVKAPKSQNTLQDDPLCRDAQAIAAKFTHIAGVPICLPLKEVGVAGIAGPRAAVVNSARSLLLQVACNQSPDEVKLVVLFPKEEADEWEWVRWLPHVWSDDRRSRFVACDAEGAHELLVALNDSLNRRKMQMAMQKETLKGAMIPFMLFVFADPRLLENEAIVALLLRDGADLGAFALFVSDRKEDLPKECRGMAVVSSGSGQIMVTKPALTQMPFIPDQAPVEMADRISRALAPIRLTNLATSADIPTKVTLIDLLGVNRVEELGTVDRWRRSEPYRSLAVPIGVRVGGEKLVLDLHERGHGPHGLGAGATGSGKSELLQTVVASLAVAFHPHDVAFVMVDYKGGGMANAFRGLPHVIGTITNLEGSLSNRALTALRAELKRRQRLLGEAGVNHIDEYMKLRRKGGDLTPLPHLIVIVDEFAELKAEQPEFMRELISAVRVGRSLGVHLILATQKPAGVVDEQIWSNTKFRLCLRVERPQDSQEVLKCPDAATITGSGRGYFQVGNNEIFELFQAAWGGAPYAPSSESVQVHYEVAEVALSGERTSLTETAKSSSGPARATQLQTLVDHLRTVAEHAGIKALEGPWTQPLPEQCVLESGDEGWTGTGWQKVGTWMEPVVGLLDDPENQRQAPVAVNLGKDGHLAVYGAPGMGKTTFVQTLITSLALAHSPAELQMYLVDCSGRSLQMFSELPHVGAVVLGEDTERMTRLFRLLLQELETRKELLAGAGVSTFANYRQISPDSLPAILVVLDNYPALAGAFPEGEEVTQLAREGGNLGIHLVVTANSPTVLRTKVSSNIAGAVALSLADRTDYAQAVGRTRGLEPAAVPGRGLVKGAPPLEFQTALAHTGENEWERTIALKRLYQVMANVWTGVRPKAVNALPAVVPLDEVLKAQDSWAEVRPDGRLTALVGLDVESLEPFPIDLRSDGPHFVVTGPPECGKTTFLQTFLLTLAEKYPPERLHIWLAEFNASGAMALMRKLPHLQAYVTGPERFGDMVNAVGERVQGQRQAPGPTELESPVTTLLVIDDLDLVLDELDMGAKDRLEQMIRRERGLGFHLLVSATNSGLQSYDSLVKALKELKTGILLGSTDHGDLALLNLRLPSGDAGKALLPGMGFFVRRGRSRKIMTATPHAGGISLDAWVERISKRCERIT